MADEVLTEVWKIKDELSREAGEDMRAYCQRLNEEARMRGEVLVRPSPPDQMKVAEEEPEYGTGDGEWEC